MQRSGCIPLSPLSAFICVNLRLNLSLNGSAGSCIRRLAVALGDQLWDQLFELAAGVGAGEVAVGVDHEHARDRVDAPALGELALPALALVILRPLDLFLGDEFLQRL